MTEEKMMEWKRRVLVLDLLDLKIEEKIQEGKITTNQKKKIEKILNKMWTDLWNFYPNKNPSVEEAFKLNFR